MKLAADIGVSLTQDDISVNHRLPGRPGTAKPIIVKFVRRDPKTTLMKSKGRLRDIDRKGVFLNDDLTPFRAKLTRVLRNDPTIGNVWTIDRKGVFLNDDLTPFRAKLTRVLRNDPTIGNVWTIDGRIFCITTENGREIKKTVESPDDLFNLGWSEDKIKGLDLYI